MTRSLAELLVGRTLADRYRIDELLGRGGMSVVYRATDSRLNRPVALKVVSLPSDHEEERRQLRERLRREAASAARIPPHPNVVQVYDYGTDPELDLDFIALELVEGRDLKSALRHGPPPLEEALRILRDAARGVAAGHRAGIVHRDVKPGNIVLSGGGRFEAVKILDFGIAKALEPGSDEELTRTGHAPHSPAYASPEQLDPGRPLNPASDVYQLGLLGYELAAGERPFGEAERSAIRAGGAVALPVRGRWAEVPPHVREVIERALRPAPEERYADAAEFAEALAHAAEGDQTLLIPPPPQPTTPPPAPAPEIPLAGPSRGTGGTAPHPLHLPQAMRTGRGAWLALGAVALLLLVWALSSGDEPTAAPAPAAPTAEFADLQEEFRTLTLEAHRSLQEAAAEEEGAAAAEEVENTIRALNESFVTGDLHDHLRWYAPRVDFYGDQGLARERVSRLRRETLNRYPEREITIERTAIEFPERGRARALVDRSWEFGGGEERWTGAGRQELVLALRDGRWRIIAERDLEVYRSERERE